MAGQLVPADLQRGPVLRVRDHGGNQAGELRHPLLGIGRLRPLPGPMAAETRRVMLIRLTGVAGLPALVM